MYLPSESSRHGKRPYIKMLMIKFIDHILEHDLIRFRQHMLQEKGVLKDAH